MLKSDHHLQNELNRSLAQGETADIQSSAGIQILPPELLSRIFLLSLSAAEAKLDYCTLDPKDTPWTLTHVCKRWRTIATSQPSLWSTLIIRPSFHPTNTSRIQYPPASALELVLNRSAPLLLKIQIWDYPVGYNIVKEMLGILMTVCQRWGEVSLNVDFYLLKDLTEVRGNLPNLSKIEFRPYGAQTFEVFDVFEDAPKLEHVLLDVDNMAPYRFPLPQLKALRGPIPGNIELLRGAPLLEELEIEFLYESHRHALIAQAPINHAALQRLKTNSLIYLKCLTAPSLKHLEICPPYPPTVIPKNIIEFTNNSRCSLTSLTMIGIDWIWDHSRLREDIQGLFSCVPQLVCLEITEEAEDEDMDDVPWAIILDSLTIADPTAETLVPHLASVRFVAKRPVAIPDIEEVLLNMLNSRYKQSGDPNGFSSEIIGFPTKSDAVT